MVRLSSRELEAGRGNAGGLQISATDRISISGPSSAISTTTFSEGEGGDIVMQASRVTLDHGGPVSAESLGRRASLGTDSQPGNASTMRITTNLALISQDSLVQATGPTADRNGEIILHGPEGSLSGSVPVLPESFMGAASLLQAGCGAARAGLSSLVVVVRGDKPADPDDYLPSFDPNFRGSVESSTGMRGHRSANVLPQPGKGLDAWLTLADKASPE